MTSAHTTHRTHIPIAEEQANLMSAIKPARVLFVPGFVADTFSEIERSYVELCSGADGTVEYVWLVPEISCKHNRFARPESRATLDEPVWIPHLRDRGIPYIVGNISKYNALTNFILFRRIFRDYEIDAVYTHFGYERFWAAFYASLLGRTVIWNEHWHSLGRRHRAFKRLFYRRCVDEFISVSSFVSGTLNGIGRVHTVPNAIMPKTFRKLSKSEVSKGRRGVAIDTRARVVLMVAAFRAEKRHTLALEICKRIIETRRDVVFVFLGAGPNRQAFISEVRSLGLEKNIIAPGHVDNVDDYYTIADVSMLTSYCEPFGYVVLEAIQHGLPVIAFDNGGPGEVIHNGETGILVPEGDIEGFSRCLLELLDNAKLREVIGEQGRLSVEQDYDRTRWIRRVNTILANAVLRGQQRLPGSLKREGKHAEEEGLR